MARHQPDARSAVDASYLARDHGSGHMHVGMIGVLEGPAPDFPAFRERVRARLALVPRYRRKLVGAPLGAALWVDDPAFDIDYHVRHTGLPAPGGAAELWRSVGRVFAQKLDRTKPLWELWLVDGLEGGRWAVGAKSHLALVDGGSDPPARDLLSVLFDDEPEAAAPEVPDPWLPRPEPTSSELAAVGLSAGIARALRLPAEAPVIAAELALAALTALSSAPRTPLTVPTGPHRVYAVARAELDDLRAVKDALGGTVNDVVLAIVAGALGRWLRERGERPEGIVPRACVPVSVSVEGAAHSLAAVAVPLPVGIADPARRLRTIAHATAELMAERGALGAQEIAGFADLAPPTLLAQASRLSLGAHGHDLVVTNVPGPQLPLYALGRRLERLYPIPVLDRERALAVAVFSYDGTVGFGLLSDLDALPDVRAIADGVRAALDELLVVAGASLGIKARPRRRSAKRAPR